MVGDGDEQEKRREESRRRMMMMMMMMMICDSVCLSIVCLSGWPKLFEILRFSRKTRVGPPYYANHFFYLIKH
jgi:hypothetical protein